MSEPHSDVQELARISGQMLGAYTKANVFVFAALISTLVKSGALTIESVDQDILKGLEESVNTHAASAHSNQTQDDLEDLERDAVLAMIKALRGILLADGEARS